MLQNRFTSLLMIICSIMLLAGCGTSDNLVSEATAGTSKQQGTIEDDLEATLEEAVLTLSTHVSDMISKINNMEAPKGTAEDKRKQYLELENELDMLDQRIDELDDTLDANVRSSSITRATYEKLNRELHSYEELIDSAEDKMDLLFGMND